MNRSFRCVAYGHNDQWSAICVDLDISVDGRSEAEVRKSLSEAISTYIEDARAEGADQAQRLLSRRAPFWVRMRLAFLTLLSSMRESGDDTATFKAVPEHCPA